MGKRDETVDTRGTESAESSGGIVDDRYELGSVLGRGAMSTVYRAKDLRLGREVALKLFLPGSGDESFKLRQQTEMRLLAAFDHPGLVQAYDAGVDTRNDEERAYLVMELAEGRDLRAVLSDAPLSVEDTAAIGARLAGALAQVHEHGVIHRDIKPANILVSDESGDAKSVKLADFGVALVMSDNRLTATGFTVGTAQYLSPEQAQGLHLTPASDIYSLGLVLLECLTGKAEYPGTPVETAAARLHRRPQVPEDLPAPVISLLEAMTDMDPERRPSADAVEQALTSPRRLSAMAATAVLPPVAPTTAPVASSAPVAARTPHVPSAPRVPSARRAARVSAARRGQENLRPTSKLRRKLLGGVAAGVAAIPLAVVLFLQGGSIAGTSADPSGPADPGTSTNERQTSVPVEAANTSPDNTVPAAVVVPVAEEAQVVTGQVQPAPANVPQEPAPAQAPKVKKAPESTLDGQVIAEVKSGGKNKTNSGKGKEGK
ncbi:protein kinase [Paenarthrobacter sp. AT5]|uniref:serine/threonine-protein kinase n=1 Tax=Paenarthrobacter TaxID=1742992 RepID=UPI001BB7E727|nr:MULTISPECIES: serine/threonine-protein kinase [Paenarthrobacter]QSZ55283.1 serine/threonine protein kinase [Paenarthrobacter ureafaciens]WOC60852.1 protein kinase [Paenarthrobacter sp. AT5]